MTEFQVLTFLSLAVVFQTLRFVHMLIALRFQTSIFLYLMALDLVGMFIAELWQYFDPAALKAVYFFLAIAGQT